MIKQTTRSRIQTFVKWWNYHFPCDEVLAKRIFKSTVNTTVALIFCLIPKVRNHLGNEPGMLPLISVIVHPGRRVSGTIQGAIYCTTGLLVGLAYSLLARFLAQRCLGSSWSILTEVQQYETNFYRFRSALAVLAVFETIMLFFHGWMRSVSAHYFAVVFPLFLVAHFAFLTSLSTGAGTIANAYSTPFYLGIAMSFFWNLVLFPEFGGTYLGNSSVNAFNEIHKDLDDAINFFVSLGQTAMGADSNSDDGDVATDKRSNTTSNTLYSKPITSLSKLLKYKSNILKKINVCGLVFQECMYEISYSYISPSKLETTFQTFKELSIYINGIINACQLQFILLGKYENLNDISLGVNPDREITFADSSKLMKILERLRNPLYELHYSLSEIMYKINLVLAFCYDVKVEKVYYPDSFHNFKFPKVTKRTDIPQDIKFGETIDQLETAFKNFESVFREELLKMNRKLIDPNDEMFLLSSFLMNFKEIVNAVVVQGRNTQKLFELRRQEESKGWLRGKHFWFTFLRNFKSFTVWLVGAPTAGTESDALQGEPQAGASYGHHPAEVIKRPAQNENDILDQKKVTHKSYDDEKVSLLPLPSIVSDITEKSSVPSITEVEQGTVSYVRRLMIALNDFCIKSKEHFRFGFQVTVALQLVSFPMFVPQLRHWYINYRGGWVGFVCILCLEPSVGGTFWVFFLRGVGVILGAFWGLVSYYAGGPHNGDPYLETIVTIFGAVPGFYYYLGTPYVKAAIIQIISIYVVLLAATLPTTIPSAIPISFGKRCLAVGYGGVVALIVQVLIFPIKARDQLNEELSFICGCLSNMLLLYATGLEGETVDKSMSETRYEKINTLSKSAKAALGRAESYNRLTRQEPRLKGEFTELEKIFDQVMFVQTQIVERIDTAALLRRHNGSAIIEELNEVVYPYRRQLIGSLTSLMREVQEAFINKTPLPQYSPSARIAHRRLINKVRQTLEIQYASKLSSRVSSRLTLARESINETSSTTDVSISTEGNDEENLMMKSLKRRHRYTPARFSTSTTSPLSIPAQVAVPTEPYINEINAVEREQQEYILKGKFLAWNASSAAMEEIIEYIEELIYLTKILVGVNEFKYGFLSRPLYKDWATEAITRFDEFVNSGAPTSTTKSFGETGSENNGGTTSNSSSSSSESGNDSSSESSVSSTSSISEREPDHDIPRPADSMISIGELEADAGLRESPPAQPSEELQASWASSEIAPDQPISEISPAESVSETLSIVSSIPSSYEEGASPLEAHPAPIALISPPNQPSQVRRGSVNLARIASHRMANDEAVFKGFRQRISSIVSGSSIRDELASLERKATLGDADSEFAGEPDSDSDEDLPLALKMVISRMGKDSQGKA